MRRSRNAWKALAVAGALVAAWSASAGADGSFTAGTGWWDQTAPEAKYQEFSEPPNGPFIESFLYRDWIREGHFVLRGTHVLRSDEAIGGGYHKARWGLDLDYSQIPHNPSFDSRTAYGHLEPGIQVLPDSLQAANQASAADSAAYVSRMVDYLSTARPIHLGLRTDLLDSRLRGRPGEGVSFELRGTRRDRSGQKAYGGSFGFGNIVETIEPIRQTMWDGMGRVSYTHQRVTVEANGGYSAFENDNSVLRWDNPRRATDAVGNPKAGQIDLYPDNQTWRAGGQVAIQLPSRTTFTGSFQWSEVTQDDAWLPYTINTAVFDSLSANPLPGTSTNAKADVLLLDGRLTTHPMPNLGGTLRYHLHKYDNKTPTWMFSGQALYDGAWNGTDVTAHPFGNEQTVYGLDLDWNPIRQVGLFGTYEYTKREHTFREVPEDKENAFEGKVKVKPRSWLSGDVRYRHGKRETEEFDEAEYQMAGVFVEQPDLRRYDVSNRDQDLIESSVSYTGLEKLTLSLNYGYLRNNYKDSGLGLQDDLRRSAGIDATLSPTDRIDLTGSLGWSRIHSSQLSRYSPTGTLATSPSSNWRARITDEIVTALADAQFRVVPDRLALLASYWYERSPGTFDLSGLEGTPQAAQDLPAILYLRQGVGAGAVYSLQENFDVGARWAWEEFDANDFATQGISLLEATPRTSPTGSPAFALFLADNTLDYHANAVAVYLTRRF
jgi:MtrB/PioB family decaheme-associated outer membrane protein